MVQRVRLTEKAQSVLQELKDTVGALMFYQSGGCCEGSQPLLYKEGTYHIGLRDVCIADVMGIKYYMSASEFNYWQYSELTIDAVKGVGVGGFSLETTVGATFVIHTRLFTEAELQVLKDSELANES